jgi:hypothetical protein
MPPNPTEEEQDRALAAYTDALMNGVPWIEDERPPLADTVELLARTVGPQPVPDALQLRLKKMIQDGWAEPRPFIGARLLGGRPLALFRPRTRRWAWAAVGTLVVLALVAALALPADGESLVGTVTGEAGPVLLVMGLALAACVGFAWLFGRRKR